MTDELDLTGEVCPYTFVRVKLHLETLPGGAELHILLDQAAAAKSLPRALVAEGHALLEVVAEGGRWRVVTRKRSDRSQAGSTPV